ncbi:MAG: glycosyl hydrolase family 8 [Puniceicoccales bacterium]
MDFKRPLTYFSALLLLSVAPLPAQSTFQGFTLSRNTPGKQDWNQFKKEFISSEGRVTDNANGGISHSEGQGYGMLLAAQYRDLATFSLLWGWTQKNLQVRDDNLFAWKWDPKHASSPIADKNNATDGDLLIAWALQRGGELWQNERLVDEAKKILRTLRQTMIVESNYGPLLLPGGSGFVKSDGVIVNLSYWVFPAFLDVKRIDPSYVWDSLYLSGTRLLAKAQFGKWKLPPDWLLVHKNGNLSLPEEFTPLFGYNAVRIPLYLHWAGDPNQSLYRPFIDWANHESNIYQLPDQVNLVTDQPGEYTVIPGMIAIYHLIDPNRVPLPNRTGGYTSYYSACLQLLSQLAAQDSGRYSSLPRP